MHAWRSLASIGLLVCGCGSDVTPLRPDAGDPPRDAGGSTPDAATLDAGGGDTWASYAEGFFATYCVECHAESPRDFRSMDDVRANAAAIRCGVSDVALGDCGAWPPPRQFPIGTGPHPSDEERQRIVAWIDADMP